MLQVTSSELHGFLVAYLFPFARIAGFFAIAPVFGQVGIPMRVRLILVIAITFLVAPAMPDMQGLLSSPNLLPIFMLQALVGIALGMVVRIVFAAIEFAGDLAGFEMSLSFAAAFDPQSGNQSPVTASFMLWIATAIFIGLDGHLLLLAGLLESFAALPPDKMPNTLAWAAVARTGALIFSLGLVLSLPLVVPLLTTNIALGLLTRAAPSLNLFSVGFPLVLLTGFSAFWLSLPYWIGGLEPVYGQAFGRLHELLLNLALPFARSL